MAYRYDYRTITLDSEKAYRQAERLQALGWTIIRSGLFTITMQSPARGK